MLENLEDACVLTGPDDSLWDKHACPAYVGPEILSSRASYSGKGFNITFSWIFSLNLQIYIGDNSRHVFFIIT